MTSDDRICVADQSNLTLSNRSTQLFEWSCFNNTLSVAMRTRMQRRRIGWLVGEFEFQTCSIFVLSSVARKLAKMKTYLKYFFDNRNAILCYKNRILVDKE